ncbi:hypothetical protein SKAU_G00330160 [Synaphobranchus kaupii]|uniref:Uncharacterized protein n=1 Tax=Synaphobranchus kaupii TaxID=118154 RepID=A0A9Q1EQD2_SYNKA|nr:hypothetical protein SKAU_G00330160 [Synaphobranchus kaupii]
MTEAGLAERNAASSIAWLLSSHCRGKYCPALATKKPAGSLQRNSPEQSRAAIQKRL